MSVRRFVLVFCLWVCWALPLLAEESKTEQEAREHYQAGEKAFAKGDYKGAIAEWETTLKLKPSSEFTKKRLAEAKAKLPPPEPAAPVSSPPPPPAAAQKTGQPPGKLVSVFYRDGKVYRTFKDGDKTYEQVDGATYYEPDSKRLAYLDKLAAEEEARKQEAWNSAKSYVGANLKAPSTAKFPTYEAIAGSIRQDKSSYTISAWVDAKNSFNAEGRIDFWVKLHPDPKRPGRWLFDGLRLDQR